MRKLTTALIVSISVFAYNQAHASSELQQTDAMMYYAKQCQKKGGTPYINANRGWQQVSAEYFYAYREQMLNLAVINAMMSGKNVSKEQLLEYLKQNRTQEMRNIENQRIVTCQ